MSLFFLIFPLFGVVLVSLQLKRGYVLGRNWKPMYYRDLQPKRFWLVIGWCVVWTILTTVMAVAIH